MAQGTRRMKHGARLNAKRSMEIKGFKSEIRNPNSAIERVTL
jgi:hypothetical protein